MQIKIEIIINDESYRIKVDNQMSLKEILKEMNLYKKGNIYDIYLLNKKKHMCLENKLIDLNVVNNDVIIIK